MSPLTHTDIMQLQETATTAAAYLDACDAGARFVRLDPAYYKACGNLLLTIFGATDATRSFPSLLEYSAAAREAAESVEMERRIGISVLGYYPQLAIALNRISN